MEERVTFSRCDLEQKRHPFWQGRLPGATRQLRAIEHAEGSGESFGALHVLARAFPTKPLLISLFNGPAISVGLTSITITVTITVAMTIGIADGFRIEFRQNSADHGDPRELKPAQSRADEALAFLTRSDDEDRC